jgi:predicted nucleic acid-binding protein
MSGVQIAEPLLAYWPKPPAIVDCNLVAAIVFDEERQVEALAALGGKHPVAPTLLRYEMANVAMNKLRRRECQLDEALEGLGHFDAFAIDLAEVALAPVLQLADRYQLSAYEAAYLWLAGELRAPLLTFDSRLAEAGRDYLARLPPP